ncbi:8165_t:CDS:1 [Ambispora gerdemannii]|uniref:Thymidine kinase n=1 Tax=Ambispora gerdemannii TaxID=144530 RepID=A0A9N9GCI6_9GLOM|nr:8165_t:CDS:1 [Ambispora gerdemannii]
MSDNKNSSLTIITGPMFAGKTEELLRQIHRCQYAQKGYLVFKPSLDNRYSSAWEIVSHNNKETKAIIVSKSEEIRNHLKPDTELIFLDEIQFFDDEIIGVLNDLANQGYQVIGAGVDKNFRGEPFNDVMKSLLAMADYVHKLTAICQVCKKEASLSQRIIDGRPARYDNPTVLVGGQETYEARCRKCHVCVKNEYGKK